MPATRYPERMSGTVVIVMGVAGVGKTTVGAELARRLGCTFLDADHDHPPANIARMARNEPLDDEDRRAWIEAVRARVEHHVARGDDVVLACSALRLAHRALLIAAAHRVVVVHLTAPRDIIAARLASRRGHFAGPALLASQFDDLQLPDESLTLDATRPVAELVAEIVATVNA